MALASDPMVKVEIMKFPIPTLSGRMSFARTFVELPAAELVAGRGSKLRPKPTLTIIGCIFTSPIFTSPRLRLRLRLRFLRGLRLRCLATEAWEFYTNDLCGLPVALARARPRLRLRTKRTATAVALARDCGCARRSCQSKSAPASLITVCGRATARIAIAAPRLRRSISSHWCSTAKTLLAKRLFVAIA